LETSPQNYRFGEFTLDIARGCVLKAGEEIKLRPKVYETLKYLVKNPGRLIGKEELIHAVWPDAFVTDDSVVQCTLELRRALDDRSQQLLKTVPRRGYLFTAEVVQTPTKAASISAVAPSELADAVRSFANDLQEVGMNQLAGVSGQDPNQAARLSKAQADSTQIQNKCK
jgi:DNA-binding winged helix-turn-helix (wHTH) protein